MYLFIKRKVSSSFVGKCLLGAFLFSLPLSIKISNISLILLTLWSIIWYFQASNKTKITKETKLIFFLLLSYYLVNLIGLPFSSNLKNALRHLEVKLPFIAFPLIFLLTNGVKWKLDQILLLFASSAIVLSIVIWSSIGYNMYVNHEHVNNYNFFIRSAFSFLTIHVIYAGTYIGTAILILISLRDKRINLIIKLASISFLLFTLIFITSRGPLIYLSIVLVVFYFKSYLQKPKQLIILCASALLGIFLIFQIPFARDKFADTLSSLKLLNESHLTERGANYHKSNLRFQFWSSAQNRIKESPIFGYGTGDAQLELRKEYIKEGLSEYLNYNAHNQYLQTLLEQGLVGIITLLIPFMLILFFAKRENKKVILAITTYFLFCFLTESYLLRQNGTMLISFFLTLFLFHLTNRYDQKRLG